jgi:hypothetical protein
MEQIQNSQTLINQEFNTKNPFGFHVIFTAQKG